MGSQELTNHSLVGFRNPVTKQLDSWRFRDPATGSIVRHLPRPRHSFDDPEAAWELIRGGFGIGYAPAWMGVQDWEQGTVLETLRDWRNEESPLYAVRLDKRFTPSRINVAQELVVELTRNWHESYARSSVAARKR